MGEIKKVKRSRTYVINCCKSIVCTSLLVREQTCESMLDVVIITKIKITLTDWGSMVILRIISISILPRMDVKGFF